MTARSPAVASLLVLLLLAQTATLGSEFSPSEPWESGPVRDGLPTDGGRHFRAAIDLSFAENGMTGATNVPAWTTLNVAELLESAGYPTTDEGSPQGFHVDLDSFYLVQVDEAGVPVSAARQPARAYPVTVDDTPFHAQHAPTILLIWIVAGPVEAGAGASLRYHVYFDSIENNGDAPVLGTPAQSRLLDTAVGPGRGTDLYVPLFPLAAPQGSAETRSVRITSLAGPVTVDIHEYTAYGTPLADSTSLTLPGKGSSGVYVLGRNGDLTSNGALWLHSTGLIAAEAMHRAVPSSIFLPAADGQYRGTQFTLAPTGDDLGLICPASALPSGTCRATVHQGSTTSYNIGRNQIRPIPISAGEPANIEVEAGEILVQRINNEPGFTAWPAADSARAHQQAIGHINPADVFIIHGITGDTRATVQSLVGANPLLDGKLHVPLEGVSNRWNERAWPGGEAAEGGVLVSTTDSGGLRVLNGDLDGSGADGGLMPLASGDGGRTYTAHVPTNDDGQALGTIHVFSPLAGTVISASQILDGALIVHPNSAPTQKHQHVQFSGGGVWTIRADQPVVAFWMKPSVNGFSGLASGWTQAGHSTLEGSQYTGHALGLDVEEPLQLARPGDQVQFSASLRNLARAVDGQSIADVASISVLAPPDWSQILVNPGFAELAPGATQTVTVQAIVPSGVDTQAGGATLRLRAVSNGNPNMVVEEPLRVNYVIHREVQVTADGQTGTAKREVASGETAAFDVRVANRGSVADSFRIAVSDSSAQWDVKVTCPTCPEGPLLRTPVLEPGASARMVLAITPTASAAQVARLNLHVQATSEADPSTTDSVRTVTQVGAERNVRFLVDEPTQTVAPGETGTFSIEVHNDSDFNEELDVRQLTDGATEWTGTRIVWRGVGDLSTLDPPNRITVPPHTAADIEIQVTAPPTASAHELHLERLRFSSSFQPDQAGTDVELRSFVAQISGVLATLTPSHLFLAPGQPFEMDLSLVSQANGPQLLTVDPTIWNWEDADRGPAPWVIDLAAGSQETLKLRGYTPADAPPTSHHPTTISVVVTGAGATDHVLQVPTTIAETRALNIEDVEAEVTPGSWNLVPVNVSNGGNVAATVNLSWVPLPTGWQAVTDAVTISANASAIIASQLFVPKETQPSTFTFQVHGEAANMPLTAQADATFDVAAPHLDWTFIERKSLDGGFAVYRYLIQNDGNAPATGVELSLWSQGLELDRVRVHQILPGSSHQVNLLAPSDAPPPMVQMTAEHLAEPMHLDESTGSVQNTSTGFLLLLAALGLLRRRSP